MKKIALIVICVFGLIASAKCDTIDFWHVYYNDIKKLDCTVYFNRTPYFLCSMPLKLSEIKNNDTIKIAYYKDAAGIDTMELFIRNKKDIEIFSMRLKDEFVQNISIPVSILANAKQIYGDGNFTVYYIKAPVTDSIILRRIIDISIE